MYFQTGKRSLGPPISHFFRQPPSGEEKSTKWYARITRKTARVMMYECVLVCDDADQLPSAVTPRPNSQHSRQ